jgi:hypothetical protein
MKRILAVLPIVTACVLLSYAGFAMAQDGAPTTMKFTSIPITELSGDLSHKIFPYRAEDRVMVIVVNPIVCGQRPINPTFAIKNGKISLHYDLTPAPAGSSLSHCSAHTQFDLEPVPHGDFLVEFTGGDEAPRVVSMMRCPTTPMKVDPWDCMVLAK